MLNGINHFRLLHKVVFGGLGALKLQSFRARRVMATFMFSNMASLEWVAFGWENWKRGRGDQVVFFTDPEEWMDERWWK